MPISIAAIVCDLVLAEVNEQGEILTNVRVFEDANGGSFKNMSQLKPVNIKPLQPVSQPLVYPLPLLPKKKYAWQPY